MKHEEVVAGQVFFVVPSGLGLRAWEEILIEAFLIESAFTEVFFFGRVVDHSCLVAVQAHLCLRLAHLVVAKGQRRTPCRTQRDGVAGQVFLSLRGLKLVAGTSV